MHPPPACLATYSGRHQADGYETGLQGTPALALRGHRPRLGPAGAVWLPRPLDAPLRRHGVVLEGGSAGSRKVVTARF